MQQTEQVRRVVATFDAIADDYDQAGVTCASAGSTTDPAAAAGYDDATTVETAVRVRHDSLDAWHTWQAWHAWSGTIGPRARWLAVPETERPVVEEAVFEILSPFEAADGSVAMGQTVRVTSGHRG